MASARPVDDYYAVLGCRRNASVAELKAAFHTLALRAHPDKVAGNAGKDVLNFGAVYKAFSTLRDPEARAAYDARFPGRIPPTPPARQEEPNPRQQADEVPEKRLQFIRQIGLKNWFQSVLCISDRRTLARRIRVLPQSALCAVAELAADYLKASSDRAGAPQGNAAPGPISERTRSKPQAALEQDGLVGGAQKAPGTYKGIHATNHPGQWDVQAGLQGLQARWRGTDWPTCVEAYELLVGLKVAFGGLIRKEGMAFEQAAMDAIAKVTAEENDGWPLPFQWAAVRHAGRKRYHSPWFYEVHVALKLRQMQYQTVVVEKASAKALRKYKEEVDKAQQEHIPKWLPSRLMRLEEDVRAHIVEGPDVSAKAACKPAGQAPLGGSRAKQQGRPQPSEGAARAAADSAVRRPRYRLRFKQPAWRYWAPARRPAARPLLLQADPDNPLCLKDDDNVPSKLQLPWFDAFAQRRGFDAAERERVLRRLAESDKVVQYLKKKADEARATHRVEQLREQRLALPWQFSDPLAVVPRDSALFDCLGLRQIFTLATVSRAGRALVKEGAPAFCSHVAFEPDLLDPQRRPSTIHHLRRNTGTKDTTARRFLSFLGTWYSIHHTRHVDLYSAPPAVKGSDHLIEVLHGLRRLESVRIGPRDWPDTRTISNLRQHLAQRAVACHVDTGGSAPSTT